MWERACPRKGAKLPARCQRLFSPESPGLPGRFQAPPPLRVWRCYDPWRCRCKVSGAMVVPGGSCLARDGQTNSGQGWLERSRKAPPLPRVSDTERRKPEHKRPLESCRVAKATLSRAGPACMVFRQVLRKRLVGVEGPGPLLTVAYRLWETWPHPAPSNADKESIG